MMIASAPVEATAIPLTGGAGDPRAAASHGRQRALTVGIDVGGTKTACVVTDATDTMLLHEIEPTQPERLAAQLSELVERAIEHFATDQDRAIQAVGVAVPGRVDPRSGTVGLAVNLGGSDIALGPLLEESVGLPCFVEHDARAAATWLRGSDTTGADTYDMAYLSVGTGISAGIVIDGRVLRGANGLAGEIGHIVGDLGESQCPCGLRGCAEIIASGPAITRLVRQRAAEGRQTSLRPDATAADLFRAAAAGDALAAELAVVIAERLARIIRGLVLTLGVNHVIVGGGVAAAGDALLRPVLEAIGRERQASPLVETAFKEATIELLSPQVEAGARGAAAIARQRIEADPREGVGDR